MTPAFNVLFLCTRNSARSIMAEAILNRFAGDKFRAYSAGSHPAEAPMPEVIEKLRSVGHDVSGLHTKSWTSSPAPMRRNSISSSRFATRSTAGPVPISATRP